MVVAFGNDRPSGRTDGALITLFNLYQAHQLQTQKVATMHLLIEVSFVTYAQSVDHIMCVYSSVYILGCMRVFLFGNPATDNYWSFVLLRSANQLIRCQFYAFCNLKQLNLLNAWHVWVFWRGKNPSISSFCPLPFLSCCCCTIEYGVVFRCRFRHKIQRCL